MGSSFLASAAAWGLFTGAHSRADQASGGAITVAKRPHSASAITPKLDEGNLLAIMSAGAYGLVMASNYNSRPRPAEVLVRGDKFALIRKRQTNKDLIRGEIDPKL